MLRKIAQFLLWLGLFGLFLTFAAYRADSTRADLLLASLALLLIAWRILRRAPQSFEPHRRFRTLRRLGLLENTTEPQENE